MRTRLADRLEEVRRRRFVGRAGEIDAFRSALAAPDLPFNLLWVYGPGGIGKTTLLKQYLRLAQEAGVTAAAIDARYVDPSPDGFLLAIGTILGLPAGQSVFDALADAPGRSVLLVDTYELLTPLDTWLREVFLPQLPEQTLIVLAGRNPLPRSWQTDPGWQNVVRVAALRNLRPAEGLEYLERRGVPAEQRAPVLDFTHGHPLALALVADAFVQRGSFSLRGDDAPDLVRTLLEQFIEKVPGPAHRAALEVCALVRLTTEGLLGELLAMPDAHEIFDWLRGLSFVEAGPQGVFPHDLARDALLADLRWRNPDWYAELHRRARAFYGSRLAQRSEAEQQRILFDYVYLHRDNPLMRPYLDWQETGTTLPDVAREGDREALRGMVAEHEGPESARWLDFWLDRHPRAGVVYRDRSGQAVAFMVGLALHEVDPDDRAADPATRAAWQYLQQRAPLRSGEKATYFRFWLARDTYQAVSAMQSLIFGRAAQHYLTTPGLAFSFFPVADTPFWAPMFEHVDLPRLPEADFDVGGRRYGVFVHDWRVTPPLSWLDLLGERELTGDPVARPQPAASALVLSEPDFAAAARDALRDYARPDALRQNLLLRSRLVLTRMGASPRPGDRVEALRALLREAVEPLRQSPRDAKLFRALLHTYFEPAGTQEQAAELLDVPFSSYRRHLAAGVSRVIASLWRREIEST